MAVYKDNATGTWRVIYRFTNWKGERKQTQKRGFATKREAQAWEHEVMLKQNSKLDMTFASFFELYEADKKQRVSGESRDTRCFQLFFPLVTGISGFFFLRYADRISLSSSGVSVEKYKTGFGVVTGLSSSQSGTELYIVFVWRYPPSISKPAPVRSVSSARQSRGSFLPVQPHIFVIMQVRVCISGSLP